MNFFTLILFICFGTILTTTRAAVDKCSCACSGTDGFQVWSSDKQMNNSQTSQLSQGLPGKRGPPGPPGEVGPPGPQGPTGQLPTPPEMWKLGSWLNPGFSCEDLLSKGVNDSGLYMIKLDGVPMPVEVFCDMESAGGGWTLVARIHENDIEGKCTPGDMWSREGGNSSIDFKESSNWNNKNSFGFPYSTADYKSQAYFALNSSNVMVWHVPNNVDFSDMSDQATFKYYTDNAFLDEYGGNLRSLYRNHYQIKRYHSRNHLSIGVNTLVGLLDLASTEITNEIEPYHTYKYDRTDYIHDGGNDMFDSKGNKVYFQIGSSAEVSIPAYNKTYYRSSAVQITTKTSQPFHALMWIGNDGGKTKNFRLTVHSATGADGSGKLSYHNGEITNGTMYLEYRALQVHSANNDPSICKVFYYIHDKKNCNAVTPQRFTPIWTTKTDPMNATVAVDGSPQEILLGYTLLSKEQGVRITSAEIESVLNVILGTFADFVKDDNGLSVPVHFLQGDKNNMSLSVPDVVRDLTEPGFLQFMSVDDSGYPFAMCPGIRAKGCAKQRTCIGGMAPDACGDFAGWDGKQNDRPSSTRPSGHAKSLNDVNSSILIFTK